MHLLHVSFFYSVEITAEKLNEDATKGVDQRYIQELSLQLRY